MLEALLAIVCAWPLISFVADRVRLERSLPPAARLEWHRGPTWLGCCAGAVPFVTLSLFQVVAIVVCFAAGCALAWLVGLFEGRADGRGQVRQEILEAAAVERQKVAQAKWGRHV